MNRDIAEAFMHQSIPASNKPKSSIVRGREQRCSAQPNAQGISRRVTIVEFTLSRCANRHQCVLGELLESAARKGHAGRVKPEPRLLSTIPTNGLLGKT